MTLDDDIEVIAKQISLKASTDDNLTAIVELDAILEELEPVEVSLRDAIGVRQHLHSIPDKFCFDENSVEEQTIKEFREQQVELADSWNDPEITYAIRQNGVVANFKSRATQLLSTIESGNEVAWNNWVDTLKTRFPATETQIESVANVPKYRTLVSEYKGTKEEFLRLSDGVPEAPGGLGEFINNLELATKSLTEILDQVEFDHPKKILKFFKDLDTNNSFPLKNYDIEIMEWLKENSALENLRITKGY